ncbi:MAG: hypothetical protein ACUVWP_04205 [bacterium]
MKNNSSSDKITNMVGSYRNSHIYKISVISILAILPIISLFHTLSYAFPKLEGTRWLWVYGEYLDTETIKEIEPDIVVLSPDLYTDSAIKDLNEAQIITLAHIPIGIVYDDSPLYLKVNFKPWVLGATGRVRLGHMVRVWSSPGWRDILGDYIEDDVMPKGFSGIFIDADLPYRMFADHRNDVLKFISDITDRFRSDFRESPIVVFGDYDILKRDDIVRNIDGFAVEGVWWDSGRIRVNSNSTEEILQLLHSAQGFGLSALVIDYPDLPGDKLEVENKADSQGFILYIPTAYWERF